MRVCVSEQHNKPQSRQCLYELWNSEDMKKERERERERGGCNYISRLKERSTCPLLSSVCCDLWWTSPTGLLTRQSKLYVLLDCLYSEMTDKASLSPCSSKTQSPPALTYVVEQGEKSILPQGRDHIGKTMFVSWVYLQPVIHTTDKQYKNEHHYLSNC